ncbi:MAG TPA: hypothetical protein PLB35_10655 [Myxococcota bacterium]|nr:hypothetical protein [Myxococcota bacterium]HOH77701.1 hypothetical protein [Myxococcota bacterium]
MSVKMAGTIVCLLSVLGVAVPALAADSESDASAKPVVAVFKFKQNQITLKQDQVDFLFQQLRDQLLGQGVFQVAPESAVAEAVASVDSGNDSDCMGDECRLQAGLKMKADKRLDITIWKGRKNCTVSGVLYDARRAVTEAAAQADEVPCAQDGLAGGLAQVVASISATHRTVGADKNALKGVDAVSESPIRRCTDCYMAGIQPGERATAVPSGSTALVGGNVSSVPGADGMAEIEVIGVRASSEMPSNNSFHAAQNVLDGKADTWWGEGVDGDGVGEWIELELKVPAEIREVRVVGGCQGGGEAGDWSRHNRIRKVRIDIAGAGAYEADLEDRAGYQAIAIPDGNTGTAVRITIMAVFPAVDAHMGGTTGIAEVQLLGVR